MVYINQIFSNKIENWSHIFNLLVQLKNDSRAGYIFEEFAKLYFLFEPVVKDDYKNVWLHSEIPLEIKSQLNLVSVDHGIDLLLETNSNEYVAVQCKFRVDQNSNLSWSKDKIANLFAYGDKCDKFIVFSNTSKLDNVSTNRKESFEFINLDNLLQIKEQTFKNISEYLDSGVINTPIKFKPKDHQIEAIEKLCSHFKNEDRGQLILPCGAGKTLTSLWIKEKLYSRNTLVLVPSLALLRQIKNSWNEQKNEFYKYLCVCSEKDIDSYKYDSPITHTYEIGGNVTTDKEKIKSFIFQDPTVKVIFSTYQSLVRIKEVFETNDFTFDLVVCDEAHKTAGVKINTAFSLIHSNANVKANKRLYMTATPRVLSEKLKTSLGSKAEKFLYDMSDEKVFGQEAFRMSFYDAINSEILVDYKILGIGVSNQELAEYLKQRRFVANKETIRDYANNYALELVMEKYKASHAISFHSRVKFAQTFSLRHKKLFDNVYCESVSGEQTTTHRNLVLNEFKNKPKGLVSNARCLTEGVDVPVIDLVYFADPKNSKIDIVQAAGRALRVDKHGNKKLGYIVVPIFHYKNKDLDKAIDQGVFKNLVNVIRSLCDQDERIQDEINKLAFEKGNRSALGERLEVTFDEAEENVVSLVGFEEKLRNALFDQVIEKASSKWDFNFLEVKYFFDKNNRFPATRQEDSLENRLGAWCATQRTNNNKKKLSQDKVIKLDSIGFIWDLRQYEWEHKYEDLKLWREFYPERWPQRIPLKRRKGNTLAISRENENSLGVWLMLVRKLYKKGSLDKTWVDKFNELGFVWDKAKSKQVWDLPQYEWEHKYEDLKLWRKIHPERWPKQISLIRRRGNTPAIIRENSLGVWLMVIKKLYREGMLDKTWVDKFNELGFVWDSEKSR